MNSAENCGFDVLGIASSLGENRIDIRKDLPEFGPVLDKTGIPYLYSTGKSSLDLAYESAAKLLSQNLVSPDDIGGLIVVTQSPDEHLPSLSCRLQSRLNLRNHVLAFDINQGCSGFVQALFIAECLLPTIKHCLIVTVDRYRSKLSVGDRSTQSIFSDASATVLLTVEPKLRVGQILQHTDGSGADKLHQPLGESLHMSGADVFVWTKRVVGPMIQELANTMGESGAPPTIAFLHQASKIVLDGLSLSVPSDVLMPRNLDKVGNTVSCSIPLLLETQLDQFRSRASILCGFGVGLSATALGIVPLLN